MPGRAAPAVSCANLCKETHTSIQVQRRQSGIPCAAGFNAYAALSPATNSSCHRRRRISGLARPGWARNTSADLTPATGARTTRFCRPRTPSPRGLAGQCTPVKTFSKAGSAPFVLRARRSLTGNPPCHRVALGAAASTASHPNVRDDGQRPSLGTGWRSCSADLGESGSGLFFREGLDG